jgi:hypothetical protein
MASKPGRWPTSSFLYTEGTAYSAPNRPSADQSQSWKTARELAFNPAVLLAVVATYAYGAALLRVSAYCVHFRIPLSLISLTQPRIVLLWTLLFVLVGTTVILADFLLALLGSELFSTSAVWLSRVGSFFFVAYVWLTVFVCWFFVLGLMSASTTVTSGVVMLGIYVLYYWLSPLWFRRGTTGLKAKLQAQDRAAASRVSSFRKGLPSLVSLKVGALLSLALLVLAVYSGDSKARNQIAFAVLLAPSGSQAQGDSTISPHDAWPLVVLYDNGDLLVCATLKATSSGGYEVASPRWFIDRSKLVRDGISMDQMNVGPLQLAPVSTLPKPVLPSNAPGKTPAGVPPPEYDP